MPHVVDANQNAQQLWLQFKAIRIPAFFQIRNLIPADATIEDLQLLRRVITKLLSGDHKRVSSTQGPRIVGTLSELFLVAMCVGD